jgi:hypothetical protein
VDSEIAEEIAVVITMRIPLPISVSMSTKAELFLLPKRLGIQSASATSMGKVVMPPKHAILYQWIVGADGFQIFI